MTFQMQYFKKGDKVVLDQDAIRKAAWWETHQSERWTQPGVVGVTKSQDSRGYVTFRMVGEMYYVPHSMLRAYCPTLRERISNDLLGVEV